MLANAPLARLPACCRHGDADGAQQGRSVGVLHGCTAVPAVPAASVPWPSPHPAWWHVAPHRLLTHTAAPSLHPCAGPPFFNQVSAELIPQNDRTVKARGGAGRQRDMAWYLARDIPLWKPYLHLLPGSLHTAPPSPLAPDSRPPPRRCNSKNSRSLDSSPSRRPPALRERWR